MPLADTNELLLPELSHLGFVRAEPAVALAPWVQSYWMVRTRVAAAAPVTENLYPDGGVSLSFELSPGATPSIHLSLSQTLHRRTFSGDVDCLGIRFHPGGAFALLGIPVGELEQTRYAAADFALPGLEELFAQLATRTDAFHRFAAFDAWLLQRAQHHQPHIGVVQTVVPALLQEESRMAAIVRGQGISRRTLERQFQLETGLAPGRLKALLRVRRARYLIKARPDLSLTEIAHACGFFDQAHFSRQFRGITSQQPGAYRRRQQQRLKKIIR